MATRIKYKYTTVRKYEGDDSYSWAIFITRRKEPVVTGLTLPEVKYHRDRIEKRELKLTEEITRKKTQPSDAKIQEAFQRTAQSIAGDIFQSCADCGEEPVLPRDCVYDYLVTHGGEYGQEVFDWVLATNSEEVEAVLNLAKVPHTWE